MTQEEEIRKAIEGYKDTGVRLCREPMRFKFGQDKETCLELLKKIMLATDGSITPAALKVTEEMRKVATWMADTRGKGLMLFGNVGNGKTAILRCIPILLSMKYRLMVRYIDARNIAEEKDMSRLYCIDDVGTEPTRNNYGERSEPFADLVSTMENYLTPLFFTTNLTPMQLTKRYDQRILDRIIGRCELIEFKSASMR